MRPLRILTWHVHSSYLTYLSYVPHEIYLPLDPTRPGGYGGRMGSSNWPDTVHEIPADEVRHAPFDCILFQSHANYLEHQYDILTPEQRRLPRLFVEHDPPRQHPVDQRHPVDDPDVLLIHVTPFNDLMWDSGRTPTRVIEHGVVVAENARYSGELPRGIVTINGLAARGRRAGADLFARARREVPLDLLGLEADQVAGGLGEINLFSLWQFAARYRFYFHPVRYTSLGLSLCEAMMTGMPVIAFATTEAATVIENGVNGYSDTRIEPLIAHMQRLLADPAEARRLGAGARRTALARFNIERFVRDWCDAFALVSGIPYEAGP
jgi:Glycosyl transferases group 1